KLAETDVFVPWQALINPGAQETDLGGVEPGTFLRHHALRIKTRYQFDQQTLIALSRNDDCAIFAALQKCLASVDPKIAFALAAPMAFCAARFQDRLDLFAEVNPVS